ncbi:MAG TPA: Wzz/FepE/Etk N-terminal domain-containing protein [Thermodesulfobacteriota bacterium]
MIEYRPGQPDVAGRRPDQDEVDLRELWEAFRRRRLAILATALGSALAAAVVVFLIPPTFESRVVIQIGQVAQVARGVGAQVAFVPLERPKDLVDRLREEHQVDADGVPRPYPRVEAVAAVDDRNPSSIIEITAHGRSAEESQAFLEAVTDGVLGHLEGLFAQYVGVQREERGRLAATVARLEEELVRLDREIESRAARSDPMTAMLVLEKSRRLSELNDLRGQIALWDQVLSPTNTYESRVIVEPTPRPSPVKPRKGLIIVMAGALGFLLAAFGVLFGHAWSRTARRAA